MRYVLTGEEAKEIDWYTIQQVGIPSVVLMERAALAVAQAVMREEERTEKRQNPCGCRKWQQWRRCTGGSTHFMATGMAQSKSLTSGGGFSWNCGMANAEAYFRADGDSDRKI